MNQNALQVTPTRHTGDDKKPVLLFDDFEKVLALSRESFQILLFMMLSDSCDVG